MEENQELLKQFKKQKTLKLTPRGLTIVWILTAAIYVFPSGGMFLIFLIGNYANNVASSPIKFIIYFLWFLVWVYAIVLPLYTIEWKIKRKKQKRAILGEVPKKSYKKPARFNLNGFAIAVGGFVGFMIWGGLIDESGSSMFDAIIAILVGIAVAYFVLRYEKNYYD